MTYIYIYTDVYSEIESSDEKLPSLHFCNLDERLDSWELEDNCWLIDCSTSGMYTMGSTWGVLSKRSWTWCLTLCSRTSGPGWLGFAPWLWGQISIALLSRSSPEHSSTWDRTLLSASPRPHFHVTSGSFSHWLVPSSPVVLELKQWLFLDLIHYNLSYRSSPFTSMVTQICVWGFHFPLVVLHTQRTISLRFWCMLGGCACTGNLYVKQPTRDQQSSWVTGLVVESW